MESRRSPLLLLLALLAACASPDAGDGGMLIGPLAADVRHDSARLWARAPEAGTLVFALVAPQRRELARVTVGPERDFTGVATARGLRASTVYRYEVRFGDRVRIGSFRTAPDAAEPARLRLAFGGDLAGQNVCRDASRGFPIFGAISAREPSVFVGLGDMIYADDLCRPVGLYGNPQVAGAFDASGALEDVRAHWRYARRDPAFARLLAERAYVAVWDDHEVVNDFGPGEARLPDGLRAFREYNPIDASQPRLHRRLRFGKHLELFVLDTRQHRDPNTRADSPAKTLLGREQRDWLVEGLRGSDATWKVVVSSVPLSVPTGADDTRRDGWAGFEGATGFEGELRGLLDALGPRALASMLWLTTDVHFAQVLRYRPFEEAPDAVLHEMVVGPLQAGIFPKRVLDESLRPERLFFHGPESFEAVGDFEEALQWFNFGELEVDTAGDLAARVIDVDGRVIFELALPAR